MENKLEILNPITLAEAKELMGNRFPTMVKYFIEDTNMYMDEIQAAVSSQDANKSLAPAHTIKSSARQLGAERVSEIAKEIEFLSRDIIDGKSDDHLKIAKLYEELNKEVKIAVVELNKL